MYSGARSAKGRQRRRAVCSLVVPRGGDVGGRARFGEGSDAGLVGSRLAGGGARGASQEEELGQARPQAGGGACDRIRLRLFYFFLRLLGHASLRHLDDAGRVRGMKFALEIDLAGFVRGGPLQRAGIARRELRRGWPGVVGRVVLGVVPGGALAW